jgi:hypothetical protein
MSPMTDEHLLPSHRDLGDAPARAPGTSRGIILAKLLWSFDMELTNEDVINWEKDIKMYAIWIRLDLLVRVRPANGNKT